MEKMSTTQVYSFRKYGTPAYSDFFGEDASFSDLEVRVRGKGSSDESDESSSLTSWRSHKVLLASMSPVLQDLVSERGNVLELYNVDGEAFKELVECFYKGELTLRNNNVWEILRVSRELGVTSAAAMCEEYISEHYDYKNALTWYANAREMQLDKELADKILEKAQRSFNVLRKTQSFRDAIGITLWDVLVSDNLMAPSERIVLESILAWVSVDVEKRRECFYKLLGTVRCRLLTSEDVKYFTRGHHPFPELAEKVREYVKERALSGTDKPRAPIFPKGVVKDMPLSMVYEVGWKLVYAAPYRNPTPVHTLESIQGACIMVAAARKGESKLAIAACGPRDVVFKRTYKENTNHANGVFWYFNVNRSFGFASLPKIELNLCDTCNIQPDNRLSWHVHEMERSQSESGGFRAGAETHLTDSTTWMKLIFSFQES